MPQAGPDQSESGDQTPILDTAVTAQHDVRAERQVIEELAAQVPRAKGCPEADQYKLPVSVEVLLHRGLLREMSE